MFNMILVLLLSCIMYVNADVFKYFNNVPHRCKEPVTGQWRDAWFYPDKCYYHNFTKNEVLQCFKAKKIALAGDSLLRNIGGHIAKIMDSSSGYKKTWGDQFFPKINLYTYWTPSVYFQQIYNNNYDIIILSMCAWDMGTYFRGFLEYKNQLITNIKRIQGGFRGRLILFLLHKTYPKIPECKGKCKEMNSEEKANRFRNIQIQVAKLLNVEVFDTFLMTDTEFAKKDAADAVHFKYNVTHMETHMLLNQIC